MRISLIAALDRNSAIGRDNALPWRLPDDLKRFKALTLGKPVLMGRKTAQSLGRALPGRLNLVLTRHMAVPFEGMVAVASVDQAIMQAQAQAAPELCVIGGGQVYDLVMAQADVLHLTHVQTTVRDADAFFPALDPQQWSVTVRERHAQDDRHALAFDFVDYVRAG